MVFRGRLRFPDAEQARRAAEHLERLDVFTGRIVLAGPAVELDVRTEAEATDYPDALAALDEISDAAVGGSVTARLGGHPSDWVGASAPLPALDGLSQEAQELLRAILGGSLESLDEGPPIVLDDALCDELRAGAAVLDTPEQLALLDALLGQGAATVTSRGPASSG